MLESAKRHDGTRAGAIRRQVGAVWLALIALMTMAGPAVAFRQQAAVNPGNPFTLEDFKAGDQNREPYQRATDLRARSSQS